MDSKYTSEDINGRKACNKAWRDSLVPPPNSHPRVLTSRREPCHRYPLWNEIFSMVNNLTPSGGVGGGGRTKSTRCTDNAQPERWLNSKSNFKANKFITPAGGRFPLFQQIGKKRARLERASALSWVNPPAIFRRALILEEAAHSPLLPLLVYRTSLLAGHTEFPFSLVSFRLTSRVTYKRVTWSLERYFSALTGVWRFVFLSCSLPRLWLIFTLASCFR